MQERTASAAIDMKCRVLILQPLSVCRLAMNLPVGRLLGCKLVMPRIRRDLYNDVLRAADLAEHRLNARVAAEATQQSIWIRQMIAEANAALHEAQRPLIRCVS